MKPLGTVVASLAYGEHMNSDAAAVLHGAQARAERELAALGVSEQSRPGMLLRAKEQVLKHIKLCESPIEQMALACLGHMVIDGIFPPTIHDVNSGDPWPSRFVVVVPQFVIARFRLDFLVSIDGQLIDVECDGKEHHSSIDDRSKDRLRDDYLRGLGIRTVRYSGNWIYKNQNRVADEIAAIAKERLAA